MVGKTPRLHRDHLVANCDSRHHRGIFEYFVKELKTPDKYTATWNGQLFQKPAAAAAGEQPGSADNPVTVKNYQPYELPKTGGVGTLPFTLFGLMICGAAVYGWMRYRRRG